MTSTISQAPSVNLLTSSMTVVTAVSTAPTPLISRPALPAAGPLASASA